MLDSIIRKHCLILIFAFVAAVMVGVVGGQGVFGQELDPKQQRWFRFYSKQKNAPKPEQMLLNSDVEPDLTNGYKPLFNGTNLDGWESRGGNSTFEVENGLIVGTCVEGSNSTYLCTKRNDYQDFIFTCDFKLKVDGNTGIQFRSQARAGENAGLESEVVFGPQVEIEGKGKPGRNWSGGIYGQSCGGYFYPLWLKEHESARAAEKKVDWNRVTILAKGNIVKTWINGVPASHWIGDGTHSQGFFALQVHKGKVGTILFRNPRINELKFSQSIGKSDDKKNVLIFHVDDLRPELSCYGENYIKSPNIDALATRGLIFDRAYCQQAICAPSRISMMSGMYPDSTGIYDLWTPLTKVKPEAMTMPRYFKDRGYETFSFGKVYHHNRDDKESWSVLGPRHTVKYADQDILDGIEQRTLEGKEKGVDIDTIRKLAKGPAFESANVPDEAYPDGKVAKSAVDALRQHKDKPFFMCVGFAKPHLPFSAPTKYWELYQTDEFDVPPRELPFDAPQLAFTKWNELRSYRGIPDEGTLDDDLTKRLKHGYAASVSFADAQVGKVMAELDRLGLREKTIVVLWGDHGYKLGDYGAWCKHTNLELDTRVPFIISAPGFPSGQRTESLVEMVDIFPTLAKLTSGGIPNSCDGISLDEILSKPAATVREFALSQYPRGSTMGYSLRNERYRYTEWINLKSGEFVARELYDHKSSQVANQNLAHNPQNADLVAKLSNQLGSAGRVKAMSNK